MVGGGEVVDGAAVVTGGLVDGGRVVVGGGIVEGAAVVESGAPFVVIAGEEEAVLVDEAGAVEEDAEPGEEQASRPKRIMPPMASAACLTKSLRDGSN